MDEKNMLIQEFEKYYKIRVSNIIKHLKIASQSGDEESIHELRVEIKRIRAFFDLIEGVGLHIDMKSLFEPIKKLFKSAAKIRDAQVILNLLREQISNAALKINISESINLLKQKEMNAKKRFYKFCKKFKVSVFKKNWNLINKMIMSLMSLKIEQKGMTERSAEYLTDLLNKINELKIKNILDEKDFHNIRILCKKARYTLEILHICYSEENFDLLNNNLRSIHQALGKWHDIDVSIISLNEVLSNQTIKPLFNESSYMESLKILEEEKFKYSNMFNERFNSLDLSLN